MTKIEVSEILDALSASVSRAGHPIPREAFAELDASGSSEELLAALEQEGVAAVLLHGKKENLGDLLQRAIGIRAEIEAPYLLIHAAGSQEANPVYHIVEGPIVLEGKSEESAKGEGKNTLVEGEPPEGHQVEVDEPSPASETLSDEETFGKAVAQTWALSAEDTTAKEPIQSTWIYTKTYKYRPYGNKADGYTPPSDQEFTVVATYIITGVLSQIASGDFQYLVAETRIWSDPGGMKKDGSSARGWGHKSVDIEMILPSSAVFYEASPGNTNNATTVTTGVSLDVGVDASGPSTGVTWSKSTSSVIQDWHIALERLNQWRYTQSSPFGSGGTAFPNSAVKSEFDGNKLKGWPDLTKKVLDQATLLVGRIVPATSAAVRLTFNLTMAAMFIRLQDYWLYWEGNWWYYTVPKSESFTVDLSTVLSRQTSGSREEKGR